MPQAHVRRADVRLPLDTLASLEAMLGDESPRLLTDLGQEHGERLSATLERNLATPLRSMTPHRFWSEVGAFLRQQGWSDVSWSQPHPGVWLARGRAPGERFPGRFFAATLEGFLSRAVGAHVSVAQVPDPKTGQAVFAMGSRPTLDRLRAELESSAPDINTALGRI